MNVEFVNSDLFCITPFSFFVFFLSTGYSYTDIEVDAIMNLGDTDGDGEIDLGMRELVIKYS